MKKEKSVVYFNFANGIEMNVEVTHDIDEDNNKIVEQAKRKLSYNMGIDIDFLVNVAGANNCHDGKWYFVDFLEYVEVVDF